jgi:hypothetical protein
VQVIISYFSPHQSRCCGGVLHTLASHPRLRSLRITNRVRTGTGGLSRCTDRPILDVHVLETPREPLARSLARIKVVIRALLHSVRDQRAVFYERAKHLRVPRTSEEHDRPTFALALITGYPHHAMHVGMKDTSTEDGEGVADVADRVAGKRLNPSLCVSITLKPVLQAKHTLT